MNQPCQAAQVYKRVENVEHFTLPPVKYGSPKLMVLKMSFLFKGMIFRFHVKLWEGFITAGARDFLNMAGCCTFQVPFPGGSLGRPVKHDTRTGGGRGLVSWNQNREELQFWVETTSLQTKQHQFPLVEAVFSTLLPVFFSRGCPW